MLASELVSDELTPLSVAMLDATAADSTTTPAARVLISVATPARVVESACIVHACMRDTFHACVQCIPVDRVLDELAMAVDRAVAEVAMAVESALVLEIRDPATVLTPAETALSPVTRALASLATPACKT